MKIIWYHFQILFVFITSCAPTEQITPELVKVPIIRQVGDLGLSKIVIGTISDEQIEATTTFRRFAPNDSKRHESWLGTDGGVPEYVVSSIVVKRGAKKVEIPYDMYSDFGDFSVQGGFPRILQSDTGFVVRHYGSDGAGSFVASFYFDDHGFDRVVISTLVFVDGGIGRVAHIRKPKAEQDAPGKP